MHNIIHHIMYNVIDNIIHSIVHHIMYNVIDNCIVLFTISCLIL